MLGGINCLGSRPGPSKGFQRRPKPSKTTNLFHLKLGKRRKTPSQVQNTRAWGAFTKGGPGRGAGGWWSDAEEEVWAAHSTMGRRDWQEGGPWEGREMLSHRESHSWFSAFKITPGLGGWGFYPLFIKLLQEKSLTLRNSSFSTSL